MSDYDNTNSGALFKNDKKESDTHPDYKGTVNVAGVEYWQSAWIKTSKDGKKYMSQSFKPKDAAPAKPAPSKTVDDFSDDIPF